MDQCTLYWGWIWHLPLFFIPGVHQYQKNYFIFGLFMLGSSFMLACIREVIGSVWLCMLCHSIVNALPEVFSYDPLGSSVANVITSAVMILVPYIADRELFISHIKYSMKSDMCRNLAYDCVMEDCMRMDNSPSILRKDGFEFLYDKYKDKIYKDMAQMAKDWGLDDRRETILPEDSHKPDMNVSTTTELPFDTDKEN